jgi:negative regulator of flagellin synthesis FlgM
MTIEINGLSGKPLPSAGEGGQVAPNGHRPSAAANTTVAAKDDQVSLTDSASRLRELENGVSQLPVVDSKRVAEVQRSIAIGSFQVDPSQVAEKMLTMDKGLP